MNQNEIIDKMLELKKNNGSKIEIQRLQQKLDKATKTTKTANEVNKTNNKSSNE